MRTRNSKLKSKPLAARIAASPAPVVRDRKVRSRLSRIGSGSTKIAIKPVKRARNFDAVRRARRAQLARLAKETVQLVILDKAYVEDISPLMSGRQTRDISSAIDESRRGTAFYPHYSQLLRNWTAGPRLQTRTTPKTAITFVHCSTLKAVRDLWHSSPHLQDAGIGVLSFASPKRPGGGFLNGSDEQEDCLVRASTLYAALTSPAASAFYAEHRDFGKTDGSGLQDHAMLYSPSILAIRDDAGRLVSPARFSVVSSVPVNAAAVRQKHTIKPDELDFFEEGMRHVQKERMARALRLFEERGDRAIVLGAFGCIGSSANKVDVVAGLWAELIALQDAPFARTFDKIVFAVPRKLSQPFKQGYEMRILQDDLERQLEVTDPTE